MMKKLSSGLDRLKKYGGAIKERLRPPYNQEPIETDDPDYIKPPMTPDEAAKTLKDECGPKKERKPLNFLDVASNTGLTGSCGFYCAQNYNGQKPKRTSKQRKIVENVDLDIDREGIPIKDLGRLSRQNDPLSVWMSEKELEEN